MQSPKGQFSVRIAIAAWVDLLGYGGQVAQSYFNPYEDSSILAHKRLKRFHEITAERSARDFPSLVLNDGAVFYRDLSLHSDAVSRDFVGRAIQYLDDLNKVEKKTGNPGARMVIAVGFRRLGRKPSTDPSVGQLASILRRFSESRVTAEEAIKEAARIPRRLDVVPQLQSNYAFAKAYMAESSGAKGGFEGPHCFLDCALLQAGGDRMFGLDHVFEWQSDAYGLRSRFGKLAEPSEGTAEIHDQLVFESGLEVAKKLSNDPRVLAKLLVRKTKFV